MIAEVLNSPFVMSRDHSMDLGAMRVLIPSSTVFTLLPLVDGHEA